MIDTSAMPRVPSVKPTATPKVSVSMITYNHEKFVAQAIESVLMQQTEYPFDLVISDDCSKDLTPEIVRAYQERYPDIIRVLPREHNIGMVPNFTDTILACTGEYIALLEGDDYWTSPHKVQMQVNFLDAHPEYSGSSHNVFVRNEAEPEKADLLCPPDQKSVLHVEDLLSTNPIPACSFVFRRRNVETLPAWCTSLAMGDWPLILLNARIGSIAYMNEALATYRIHDTNNWMGSTQIERCVGMLNAVRCYQAHFGSQYADITNRSLCYWLYSLSSRCEQIGKRQDARKYLFDLFRSMSGRIFYANRKKYAKLFLRVILPRLYYGCQRFSHARHL